MMSRVVMTRWTNSLVCGYAEIEWVRLVAVLNTTDTEPCKYVMVTISILWMKMCAYQGHRSRSRRYRGRGTNVESKTY